MSTAPPDLSRAVWVKSRHSNGGGGGCVEWCTTFATHGIIPVRDSKDPEGPALTFPVASWSAFVAAVKRQEFPTH